jgi:hypothetical protein
MTINWNAVAQGITTGLVGASVFWIIGLIREFVRNAWLRRRIRKELRHVSCGHGIQGVNASVQNRLQKAFRIRDVTLVTSNAQFAFNATGEVSSCPPPDRKLARKIKRRLKRGEAVSMSTHVSNRTWIKKPEHAGFVEATPFTSQGFLLPLELMENIDGPILNLLITVEYETWNKRTRLLTVATEGWAVEHMQRCIEHVRSELDSGRLNQARMMFGLKPIAIKPRRAAASTNV